MDLGINIFFIIFLKTNKFQRRNEFVKKLFDLLHDVIFTSEKDL